MANKNLFKPYAGAKLPAVDALNSEGAGAYALAPKHALAQLATTGCLNGTFYCGASGQLDAAMKLARELDAEFVAKTAVYAREYGHMKDMPALLLAVLSTKDAQLLRRV